LLRHTESGVQYVGQTTKTSLCEIEKSICNEELYIPALDACEPEVTRALQKDGWIVVEKPYTIRFEDRHLYADMRLQKLHADFNEEIIILEVKCFTDEQADLAEFYTAIGQYQVYRNGVLLEGKSYPIFLAIPYLAYERLINQALFANTLHDAGVKLVIVDIETEEVVQWLP
jgi:XisH protein